MENVQKSIQEGEKGGAGWKGGDRRRRSCVSDTFVFVCVFGKVVCIFKF